VAAGCSVVGSAGSRQRKKRRRPKVPLHATLAANLSIGVITSVPQLFAQCLANYPTHAPTPAPPDHEPAVAAGLGHAPHRPANLLPLLATLAHQLQQLGVLLGGPLALQAGRQAG
jgi:hypothetical protein